VVITHGWQSASVAVALWASDVPIVVSAHDYGMFCATRRLLYGGATCSGPAIGKCVPCAAEYYGRPKGWIATAGVWLSNRIIARRIVATHSVTSFVDETLGKYLIRESARGRTRRFVIPAFVDMSTEEPGRERDIASVVDRLPAQPFILFVGAFRRDKGLEVLFEAYRQLEDPPPLVLLGTQERDTPRFPQDVTVLYDVPHAAVVRAWDRAMIGVVPSLLPEPLGTVALEGLAQGVPVIATEPSGMRDVLRGGCGVLVPQGDAPALAEALKTVIADESLRERLRSRGLKRAEDYRPGPVLARYDQMLTELANLHGSDDR
jgi:glycosyltransferase involved in cell wall biosynthesis